MKRKIIENKIDDFRNIIKAEQTFLGKQISLENYRTKEEDYTYNFIFDKSENTLVRKIQLFYNGEPATKICDQFYASFIPGDLNDKGAHEEYLVLDIDNPGESIITFTLPRINIDSIFSVHKNGSSYSNYALFGSVANELYASDVLDSNNPGRNRRNILFIVGKIYRTDIIGDIRSGHHER